MLPIAKLRPRSLRFSLLLIASGLFALLLSQPATLTAQSRQQPALANPARITAPVDDSVLTTLKGNVHPLARAQYDQGAVAPSLPMARILMILKPGDAQAAALKSLLDQQQDKHSPSYRQWLTPTQLGQTYGPAAADIKTVTAWLQSHGFTIGNVSKSGFFIEFSGTAGQVATTFHTGMHSYLVDGQRHYANASDPRIPTALTPVVAGFASLNDFPRKPMSRLAGEFQREKATGKVTRMAAKPGSNSGSKPLFTFTSNEGDLYAVGPYDLATIYNITPLWNASQDGTGQTIAIAGRTNINPQDAYDFRTLFSLPTGGSLAAFQQSYLNIILNGPDPGNLQGGEEGEANIDVQWSGAVAKGALIDFVVSETTTTTDGADLSAEYIIDNNLAPVMSYSFGSCELALGTSGNLFYQVLWEQAAAQGISAFVAAGDAGSAGCDQNQTTATYGFEVSGNASTPFNVAVGGTDFDQLSNNPANYWNATNDSTTQASAKGYIPETTWNNSCTNQAYSVLSGSTDPLTNCNNSDVISTSDGGGLQVGGGGGGPSNCITDACDVGYAKPSWQIGTPADNVRDLPDVSLFASNGFAGSFYIICQSDTNTSGTCNLNSPYADFAGYGGTSVASPATAGMFGILNQKVGSRVGNPNYALYNLASQASASSCNSTSGPGGSCIFNDVTKGTISQVCGSGTTNCLVGSGDTYGVVVSDDGSGYNSNDASGYPGDLAWNTAVGYDYATGLGSLNAANLVDQWTNANFLATSVTLALSSTSFVHGSSTTATVEVTSNTGTPTGDVSFNGPVPNGSIGYASLGSNGAASVTLNSLPGGSYNVTAHYGGNNDGTDIWGGSDSNPVAVVITPETSTTTLANYLYNPSTNTLTSITSAPYGSELFTRVQVAGASGYGSPTGSATLTANGSPLTGSPFTLNIEGNAEAQFYSLNPGTNALASTYSGDASFDASAATSTLTITQATPTPTLASSASSVASGASVTLTSVFDTTTYIGVAPTGTVTFYAGTAAIGSPVNVTSAVDAAGLPEATAALTTTALPVGANTITAVYSGDANYTAVTSPAVTVTVTGTSTLLTPTVTVVASPSSIAQNGTTTITITVAGATGKPTPTGTVTLAAANYTALSTTLTLSNGTATFTIPANSDLPVGTANVTATYNGDATYATATGTTSVTITAEAFSGTFTLSATAATVSTPGTSGTSTISVAPSASAVGTGTLNFTCVLATSPSGANATYNPACAISPTSVSLNGATAPPTATATISTTAPTTSALSYPKTNGGRRWYSAAGGAALACVLFFGIPARRRGWKSMLSLLVFLVAMAGVGCGGGSSNNGGGSTGGTSTGTYTFTVTGTTGTGSSAISVPATLTVTVN